MWSVFFFHFVPPRSGFASVVLKRTMSSRIKNFCCFWLYWSVWFSVSTVMELNGIILSPLCIVHHIIFNARFIISVRPILSFELATIKIFKICIARLTAPVSSCNLGGLYSIQCFVFYKTFCVLWYESTAPIWFGFLRTTWRLTKFSTKFMTSFALIVLHIRTTGHLLYQSIPIKNFGSQVTCLLCSLPKNSTFISCPLSVNTGNLIFFRRR